MEALAGFCRNNDDLEAPRGAEVVHGSVHLRSSRAYRRLIPHAFATGGKAGDVVRSAELWSWVSRWRRALIIDTALLQVIIPSGDGERMDLDASHDDIELTASVRRYLDQQASHILVLPLLDLSQALAGMVTLEFDAADQIGEVFPPPALVETLQTVVDAAAPRLLTRPPRANQGFETDELLPVAGPTMTPVLELLAAFARHGETLLLSGQTGTGKSRLARWCHAQSPRADGPFEVLDLMTIPETMHMARLMGWKRGAFTGATSNVDGAVSRAHGGTLFIDEIDKLSADTQAGLLQLLEDRSYRVLGDNGGDRRADVRFIVGTNVDLMSQVEAGRFRRDLYYRIHVLPVQVPALDERSDEIADWARFMLARCSQQLDAGDWKFSESALLELEKQSWPGNLRQLDNVVRRTHIMARARGGEAAVTRADVLRALAMENPTAPSISDHLRRAAHAFVQLALTGDGHGRPLNLELADAFAGHVLDQAVKCSPSKAKAFDLVGLGNLVEHKNHYRRYRKAQEDIAALERREAQVHAMGPLASEEAKHRGAD
ncbi:sigma-54-dependent transcriptional regulator [Persicimonas caeni]|nr:sigma 54-interacting transcriptional regulator [Persicimonas caeni]